MSDPDDTYLDMDELFPASAADGNDILKARLLAKTMQETVRTTKRIPKTTPKDRTMARDLLLGERKLPNVPTEGVMVHLAALITEFDRTVIMDATRIRNYVTNKLMALSVDPDARVQLKALELLGKIQDVALFADRKEITITENESETVRALRERLSRLKALNTSDVVDITPVEPEKEPPVTRYDD